jgi:hypothetical protein
MDLKNKKKLNEFLFSFTLGYLLGMAAVAILVVFS